MSVLTWQQQLHDMNENLVPFLDAWGIDASDLSRRIKDVLRSGSEDGRSKEPQCGICLGPLHNPIVATRAGYTESYVTIGCDHEYCAACLGRHVLTVVESGRHMVTCPEPSCGNELSVGDVLRIEAASGQVLHEKLVANRAKVYHQRDIEAEPDVAQEIHEGKLRLCPVCRAVTYRDMGCSTIACVCGAIWDFEVGHVYERVRNIQTHHYDRRSRRHRAVLSPLIEVEPYRSVLRPLLYQVEAVVDAQGLLTVLIEDPTQDNAIRLIDAMVVRRGGTWLNSQSHVQLVLPNTDRSVLHRALSLVDRYQGVVEWTVDFINGTRLVEKAHPTRVEDQLKQMLRRPLVLYQRSEPSDAFLVHITRSHQVIIHSIHGDVILVE